ncbi:MAG: ParB/RepB/Spo0J family partition protein [Gammaproteobacteria bacterium]|nr:ParB/RepB/Spo0J family partition protein [Gammaproteobacteria bacterium]
MSSKKRGLGKGLDALLGPRAAMDLGAAEGGDELRTVPIDLFQRSSFQPRSDFKKEGLEELARSIRVQGIIQPIVARRTTGSDKYEIVAGERRWRAAQLAGLQEVPAVIRALDDRSAMCLSLIENIQREDLNPLEQARALSRLLEEFNLTHEEVADAVGRSRSTVSNLLRLLELDAQVKSLVESGQLEMGHARALLGISPAQQAGVARQVIAAGLSVRATEALVRRLQSGNRRERRGNGQTDPDIRRLETQLSETLGAAVAIRHKKSGKGKLEISYNSLSELDGILSRIK